MFEFFVILCLLWLAFWQVRIARHLRQIDEAINRAGR
jgi:cytochrome oxidase assembly protein ShyY1